jgi:hypothetical protein
MSVTEADGRFKLGHEGSNRPIPQLWWEAK